MKENIRLNAVGDVMLGDFPLLLGFGVRSSLRNSPGRNPFAKVRHVLGDCDICFGNLETVLSDHGLLDNDLVSSQMRGDPASVSLLKDAGFNVMSVANNHAMQHGPDAFFETGDRLSREGITPIGLAGDNGRVVPHFREVRGVRLCFLGYSQRPEKYHPEILYARAGADEIVKDIRMGKAESDVVIVSLHWGDEFITVPSQEQIRNAHSFVDAGASLVIGHHPHVIQGIERYKDGVIAYSLGNFVFDFWQKSMRKTMILHCGLSKSGVEDFNLIAASIDKEYRPVLLKGSERVEFFKMVDNLSEKILRVDTLSSKEHRKYRFCVNMALLKNKIQNRIFFLRKIFKYDKWVVEQSISNFVKSRCE